jgi:hypothetical protein
MLYSATRSTRRRISSAGDRCRRRHVVYKDKRHRQRCPGRSADGVYGYPEGCAESLARGPETRKRALAQEHDVAADPPCPRSAPCQAAVRKETAIIIRLAAALPARSASLHDGDNRDPATTAATGARADDISAGGRSSSLTNDITSLRGSASRGSRLPRADQAREGESMKHSLRQHGLTIIGFIGRRRPSLSSSGRGWCRPTSSTPPSRSHRESVAARTQRLGDAELVDALRPTTSTVPRPTWRSTNRQTTTASVA